MRRRSFGFKKCTVRSPMRCTGSCQFGLGLGYPRAETFVIQDSQYVASTNLAVEAGLDVCDLPG